MNLCAMFCIYGVCFGGVVEEKLIHRNKFSFGMEESEEARWHPRASRNFSRMRSEFADLVLILIFNFFFPPGYDLELSDGRSICFVHSY